MEIRIAEIYWRGMDIEEAQAAARRRPILAGIQARIRTFFGEEPEAAPGLERDDTAKRRPGMGM